MIERLGILIISQVAGDAGDTQSPELTHCCAEVTRGTIHRRVRANQREAILMRVDSLNRYVPPIHGVALLALGSKLASVQVRMAVGALCAYIPEEQFHVA